MVLFIRFHYFFLYSFLTNLFQKAYLFKFSAWSIVLLFFMTALSNSCSVFFYSIRLIMFRSKLAILSVCACIIVVWFLALLVWVSTYSWTSKIFVAIHNINCISVISATSAHFRILNGEVMWLFGGKKMYSGFLSCQSSCAGFFSTLWAEFFQSLKLLSFRWIFCCCCCSFILFDDLGLVLLWFKMGSVNWLCFWKI